MSVTAKAQRKEKVLKTPVQKQPVNMKKTAQKMTYDNPTPAGEKPDLTEFPNEYCPPRVECAWYSWWEKQGLFKPKGDSDDKFVMILPPPNVTGELHLGHALTSSIEDAITRYNRMDGKDTIWVPGTDHAGIATQVRVEQMLAKEKGITKAQLTREQFMEAAFEWTKKYGGNINNQLRLMGSSLDWEQYFFTFDEQRNKSVKKAFVNLFNKKKVYRAERLVNWDCTLQTAISDAEVEYITIPKRTRIKVPGHKFEEYPFGVFQYFRYPIADENGQPTSETVLIATTRLETMLGDEAVAINSKDEQYKHLHGKRVYHPFRKITIPIIIDDELVEIGYGTGIVKVTPAHDPNDFECGKRHNLPFTNVLTKDGKMNDIVPEFAGLPRFDARIEIAKRLKEMGLFDHEEDHEMRLGLSQRGHDVVEQVVTLQWFVDTTEMAQRALDAVDSGELKIIPKEFEVDWRQWHQNIRPWCISRQLWWGHRIPAYKILVDGKELEGDTYETYVAAESDEEALQLAVAKAGVDASRVTVEQDPDVLDTWFSSGLLPFSALKWPDETPELKKYFPGTLLETGWDILTFWVSRMVMLSLELLDTVPFKYVLLHPLIRDAQGRKMSKSLGNVINPIHCIDGISLEELISNLLESHLDPKEEKIATDNMKVDYPNGIPQLGCDALRLALCSFAGMSRTANISINKIVSFRNFCNKMWNAVKFVMPHFDQFKGVDFSAGLLPIDKWILGRLSNAIKICNEGFESLILGQMVDTIIHFFQDEFCNLYLEAVKPAVNGSDEARKKTVVSVIYECIETSLRMIHPTMPFVTEDLWQRIPRRFNVESIMVAPYPKVNQEWAAFDGSLIENAIAIATACRRVKTNYNLKTSDIPVHIATNIEGIDTVIDTVRALGHIGETTVIPFGAKPEPGFCGEVVNEQIEVRMNLVGLIDFEKEIARCESNKKKLEGCADNLRKKRANATYEQRVPANVREAEGEKLASYEAQIATIEQMVNTLKLATQQ